jgi:hypothetical protein
MGPVRHQALPVFYPDSVNDAEALSDLPDIFRFVRVHDHTFYATK